MPILAAYSFNDVTAVLSGPGGSIVIGGPDAGSAEEGISIEMAEDINNMIVGAAGDVQHNLRVSTAGTIITRLLKTSPVNAQLVTLYNFQRISTALHGRNTIIIRNPSLGDIESARGVAFARLPNRGYAKDGAVLEWHFHAAKIDSVLGGRAASAL